MDPYSYILLVGELFIRNENNTFGIKIQMFVFVVSAILDFGKKMIVVY